MEIEKNTLNADKWVQLALVNFCIVALAGVTLRYKINFPLPSINQKHLLHGHSYFAFVGWVTIVLMALMVKYLHQHEVFGHNKIYKWLLRLNVISAYGMFVSFVMQGYDTLSISFSFFSILISYIFIFFYWRNLNKVTDISYAPKWLKGSLVLWAISSLGAIALAILMTNKVMVLDFYFGAIYFFLHFQYNGWFLFACFGFSFSALYRKGFLTTVSVSKKLFFIMALTAIPAYILSIIWLKLPPVMIWTGRIAGIFQLLVLIYFIRLYPLLKGDHFKQFSLVTRWMWGMASIAFILKITLQLLSIFPYFSNYAFTYRPIIIGYLHLSFLGVISFFIIGYIDVFLRETQRGLSKIGIFIFVFGVLAQEFILMMQGLEALNFNRVKWANIGLFYCAVLILLGLIIAVATFNKKRPELLYPAPR